MCARNGVGAVGGLKPASRLESLERVSVSEAGVLSARRSERWALKTPPDP